jgi:uncharacterized membrane protein
MSTEAIFSAEHHLFHAAALTAIVGGAMSWQAQNFSHGLRTDYRKSLDFCNWDSIVLQHYIIIKSHFWFCATNFLLGFLLLLLWLPNLYFVNVLVAICFYLHFNCCGCQFPTIQLEYDCL